MILVVVFWRSLCLVGKCHFVIMNIKIPETALCYYFQAATDIQTTEASYSNESISFKWEWPILHPSSLCCPSFMVEGKRQAGSSHLNDKFSFEWDTTVVINKVINNSDHSVSKSRHRRILSIGRSRNCVKGYYFVKRYLIIREQIFQEIQFHLYASAWT